MLTMAEKFFLGLTVTLSIVVTGLVVLPVFSYEVSLALSPNRDSYYIPAGKPFNVTCEGSGDDADKFSSIKWLNQEGRIIQEGVPGTQIEGKNSLTLTFADPKKKESGVYKCIALYEERQTLEKPVTIIFYGNKPSFEDTFQNVTATEDSFLEIPCAAEGESPITYEWFNQNEEKITENSNSSLYVSGTVNASVLTIPRVKLNNAGMYTCLANNSHGLSSKIFQLMVLPACGDDTNGTTSFISALVVNITTTSVRFAFNVTGPVKYIEVRYQENRSAEEYFADLKYGDNYEIKNLIPAGLYSFKFRVNPSEDDRWSEIYQVILLPEKPEVIIRTIDSGTIKFDWLFKFEDKMRKTIDRHEITYFSLQLLGIDNSWKPSGCGITVQIPQCTASSYTISGLSQRVYYEFQLRAHTAAGYSEPYKQKVFF